MKTRITIAAAIALLMVVAFAGAALAQGGPPPDRSGLPGDGPGPDGGPGAPGSGPGPGMGGPGPVEPRGFGPPLGGGLLGLRLPPPEALERLGLSDAQRAKIDSLRDVEERKAIRAEGDMRIGELDLQKLIESDKPDAAAIDAAIVRLSTIRTETLRTRAATILGIRAVLTPEQRTKLRRPPSGSPWH